jgi:hypothetical protein
VPHLESAQYRDWVLAISRRLGSQVVVASTGMAPESSLISPKSAPLSYHSQLLPPISMAEGNVKEEPFPAPSRREAGLVDGIETEITKTNFSDKIMITLSQGGRLAQWVGAWAWFYYLKFAADIMSRSKSLSRSHRRQTWTWPFLRSRATYHQCISLLGHSSVVAARIGKPSASSMPVRLGALLRLYLPSHRVVARPPSRGDAWPSRSAFKELTGNT